ncbi:MAG: hypothetical protein ABL921_26710 [Pirellula sp.]
MLWNTPLIQCLANSCWVCLGATGLAMILGGSLAALTTCFRVPFGRSLSVCMLSLILVPVYVQATAWSAGFGVQGWFKLSQVAAATSPVRAIASVIWIHGTACAPICFLFCALGIRRSMDLSVRQALLDFGPWFAATRVILPKAWPWCLAGCLWTVAMVGNDMVVTNLFQLPTLTETVYQQIQFNELHWSTLLAACIMPGMIASVAVICYALFPDILKGELSSDDASQWDALALIGPMRWVASWLAFVIVMIVAILPLLSLIVKAGWRARVVDGELQRDWSLRVLIHSFGQITNFSNELSWSIQLSLYSSCVAILVAVALLLAMEVIPASGMSIGLLRSRSGDRGKCRNVLLLAGMFFLLSTPGPLVNLTVLQLLHRPNSDLLAFLTDQTLLGPIVAMQSRCLPLAFGILWLAKTRFAVRNNLTLRLDQGLPWKDRLWVWATAMRIPGVYAFAVSVFVSFADLSTYLLVQPPGVTTVAMRMFDLLHYGVKNQEAALALALAMVSMAITYRLLAKVR